MNVRPHQAQLPPSLAGCRALPSSAAARSDGRAATAGLACMPGAGGLLADGHASVLKALSSPLRLKLFKAVQAGPRPLPALVAEMGARPATVRRHLHLLCDAGLLQQRVHGGKARYRQAEGAPLRLAQALCSALLPAAAHRGPR